MPAEKLSSSILKKKSYLCIGLDTDLKKIPGHLLSCKDPLFEFNRAIIEATADYAVAYKPNLAFYEALGSSGWESLQKTLGIIPKDCLTIADAKRGDIGNTAALYARSFFETLNFDAITLSPYMGEEVAAPFLAYPGKLVFILGKTSNPSAKAIQELPVRGKALYEVVMEQAAEWGATKPAQLGFVMGATDIAALARARKQFPKSCLLVPGVGAQGGSVSEVLKAGVTASQNGLLINVSRSILYAGSGKSFSSAAKAAAQHLQAAMLPYF